MNISCKVCDRRITAGEPAVKVEVGRYAGIWMRMFNAISFFAERGRGVSVAHQRCIMSETWEMNKEELPERKAALLIDNMAEQTTIDLNRLASNER